MYPKVKIESNNIIIRRNLTEVMLVQLVVLRLCLVLLQTQKLIMDREIIFKKKFP